MGRIVLPGEAVSDKAERIAYSFVENGKTYATVLSLMNDEGRLIPLEGPYEPLVDDYVIGVVTYVKFVGYTVEMNSPYEGFLSSRETRDKFELADVVFAKIRSVDEVKNINLTDARMLREGRLVSVSAVKVPRIIGKKNSMLNMIKEATGCEIFVGRNGLIWMSREGDVNLAIRTIEMIEREAHVPGLTDRVGKYLSENKKAGASQSAAPSQ